MEACGSSHYWVRKLAELDHGVRLIPTPYVKPFVKRAKNDRNDAEAICEPLGARGCDSFWPRPRSSKPKAWS
jgi:transposase